jgi:hypothetical protein
MQNSNSISLLSPSRPVSQVLLKSFGCGHSPRTLKVSLWPAPRVRLITEWCVHPGIPGRTPM